MEIGSGQRIKRKRSGNVKVQIRAPERVLSPAVARRDGCDTDLTNETNLVPVQYRLGVF